MTMKEKDKKKLMIDTNRRLQETTQKLFMAKQELEQKNKELEIAREKERQQKEQLKHELQALEHLARLPRTSRRAGLRGLSADRAGARRKKKLTTSIAEDLSLRYIHILESYIKTKDIGKDEPLVEELSQKLIEYDITPKGIIDIHLKVVPQIKTIGDLETKRITFESRMVLLKVMTNYATLLRNQSV